MVHWTPEPVVANCVAVPRPIIERNKIVTMAVDAFFFDGIPFLLTVSRQIKFIMVEHVATRTAKSLSKHLERLPQVYLWGGFNVCTILMDGKFEKVQDELPWVVCNTTATKEHVRKAERLLRMIK
jgi:hypothetical protein